MKSGWFRRLISSPRDQRTTTAAEETNGIQAIEDEELLGCTKELIEFVKTFTVDTFKDFQLRKENDGGGASPSAVRTELSDWQARHATCVLAKVKEISNLRYVLCPRHLKEHVFWEIYFRLVEHYIKKYEQHAIRQEQMKKITTERKNKDAQVNGFEVEMAETKKQCSSSSSVTQDQQLHSRDLDTSDATNV